MRDLGFLTFCSFSVSFVFSAIKRCVRVGVISVVDPNEDFVERSRCFDLR